MRKYFLSSAVILTIVNFSGAGQRNAYADFIGPMSEVPETFNRSAKKSNLPVRMVLRKCVNQKLNMCQYSIPGSIGALVTSSDDNKDVAELITFVFAKGSDAKLWISVIINALNNWSPTADQVERKTALFALADNLETRRVNEIVLGGIKYEMRAPEGLGIFLNIVRADRPNR